MDLCLQSPSILHTLSYWPGSSSYPIQRTHSTKDKWTENQSGSSWPYLAMTEALTCAKPWASSFVHIISSYPEIRSMIWLSTKRKHLGKKLSRLSRYTLIFHTTILQTIDYNNCSYCIYIVFGIIDNLGELYNTQESCVLLYNFT